MTYDELIQSKLRSVQDSGFDPLPFTAPLFDWQKVIVSWAVKRGKVALFEECGLGKTIQQLEWADQVRRHTQRAVIIICPLAVQFQTVEEGKRFGISVTACKDMSDVDPFGINIINCDRIECLDPSVFAGVVLDESSILKGLTGKTRRVLTEMFSGTQYQLCCTATPAPNDFTELGQHSEFLGVCKYNEMLAEFFINDTFNTGDWRLKKHAETIFWRWVASWAACISKPSDIGFSDAGYDLPPVNIQYVTVAVDHKAEDGSEELFALAAPSATEIHKHNRKTMNERCRAAAEVVNASNETFIVWCESNEESQLLTELIQDAIEVKGSDSSEKKEARLRSFTEGQSRVIVTKPSIAGFGLNWQHCRNEIFVGMGYSFEKYYQAGKRIHRFGQTKTVNRYIVQTDAENGVLRTIDRKENQHEQMRELMQFTKDELGKQNKIVTMKTDIYHCWKENWTMYHGDCVRVASLLEPESIGFSVFSPPFADLFTYSNDIQDMGNCRDTDAFLEQFGFLVDQLHRVLMPGRLVAVHCCDLLASKWKDGDIEFKDFSGMLVNAFRDKGFLFHSRITIWKSPVTEMQRTKAHGLLYKTLKSDSSKSRVGSADYLLVFKKRGVNPKPITHTEHDLPLDLWQEIASPVWMTVDQGRVLNGKFAREDQDEKHICPLQLDVIERALHMWSAAGDTVFSPFAGIGSEGVCSVKMGRKFIGSELKRSYFQTACQYIEQADRERGDLFQLAK